MKKLLLGVICVMGLIVGTAQAQWFLIKKTHNNLDMPVNSSTTIHREVLGEYATVSECLTYKQDTFAKATVDAYRIFAPMKSYHVSTIDEKYTLVVRDHTPELQRTFVTSDSFTCETAAQTINY